MQTWRRVNRNKRSNKQPGAALNHIQIIINPESFWAKLGKTNRFSNGWRGFLLLCDCRFCDVDLVWRIKKNTATFSLGDIIVQSKKSNVASPLFPLSLSCTVIHDSEHKDYIFFFRSISDVFNSLWTLLYQSCGRCKLSIYESARLGKPCFCQTTGCLKRHLRCFYFSLSKLILLNLLCRSSGFCHWIINHPIFILQLPIYTT